MDSIHTYLFHRLHYLVAKDTSLLELLGLTMEQLLTTVFCRLTTKHAQPSRIPCQQCFKGLQLLDYPILQTSSANSAEGWFPLQWNQMLEKVSWLERCPDFRSGVGTNPSVLTIQHVLIGGVHIWEVHYKSIRYYWIASTFGNPCTVILGGSSL